MEELNKVFLLYQYFLLNEICFLSQKCSERIKEVDSFLEGGALVDVRNSYQKLYDAAVGMKSEYSLLNEKLFLCRKVFDISICFLVYEIYFISLFFLV